MADKFSLNKFLSIVFLVIIVSFNITSASSSLPSSINKGYSLVSELKGKEYRINQMAAEQIETIKDLSNTAKILLSAVAGAVIQHLIDKKCPIDKIFEYGIFTIKE